MGLKDKLVGVAKNTALLPLYDIFGGLSEFWAAVFGTCGIILAFKGKLDANFAVMITAVQALLVAHDALDDYHSRKKRDAERADAQRSSQ